MRVERQKLMDKSQAYFWTKEWQEAEKEASKDIKAGRVKAFDTVEELFEDLG
jgi:TRAP-type C4-dicarboxylate transport system substrate-binding protein